MNHFALSLPTAATIIKGERTFFLSELLGSKVIARAKNVGSLTDVVIKENSTLPLVTHVCVSRPFGEFALVPWERVESVEAKDIRLAIDDIAVYNGKPDDDAVLLKDNILDKKAMDLDGRELDVVYDIKLALRNGKLYVTDVDLSRYGLLRRMGLTGLASFIYNLAASVQEQTISWKYIRPLPKEIGLFRGDVQLNVLKEKLDDMHPVDLADMLEELDPDQRVEIFERPDPEQASDTLEEIDPNAQRDLVESLDIGKVAQVIAEMTTGQAADVLSALSAAEADAVLERLNGEAARKILAIMEHHEENILDFATEDFIAYRPDTTAGEVKDEYRDTAKGKDVVMYLYVVDDKKRLHGVLDIKELLMADDEALLKDVMIDHVVTLEHDSTIRKAAELFARYNFRALPITDAENKILGVVSYRDVMELKHRYVD